MFAVTVCITLRPGAAATFLPQMAENAAASLRDEPDCHLFDICTDPTRPDEVFLYELYTDAAAFDRHLGTPHFLGFDGQTCNLIAEKRVRTFAGVTR